MAMLLVPFPVAILIKVKAWSHLLLQIFWHRALRAFAGHGRRAVGTIPDRPPQDSPSWKCVGMHAAPLAFVSGTSPISAEAFQDVSNAMRLLAADLAPVRHAQLLELVIKLDCWADKMARHTARSAHGRGQFRFSSMRLLECIRLCRFLKGGPSRLEEVIPRCLAMELPPDLRGVFLQGKNQLVSKTPSPSLLRRYMFSLDVALTLLERDRSISCKATSYLKWDWSDSSPMGGYDWLWFQHHEIKTSDLLPVFNAVTSLGNAIQDHCDRRAATELPTNLGECDQAHPHGLQHERSSGDPLEEWRPWLATIRSSIREHIYMPGALASGHRGLHDKVAAELFKWYLQTHSSVSMTTVAQTHLAQTGDMGLDGYPRCPHQIA